MSYDFQFNILKEEVNLIKYTKALAVLKDKNNIFGYQKISCSKNISLEYERRFLVIFKGLELK